MPPSPDKSDNKIQIPRNNKSSLEYSQFVGAIEQVPENIKEQLLSKAQEGGKNPTPHAVESIRSAYQSPQERESSPDKSSTLLASLYLEKASNGRWRINLQKGKERGKDDKDFAEYKIGLGQLLNRAVEKVKIWNSAQPPEFVGEATRQIGPDGNEAYFLPNGRYAAVFTGYTFEVSSRLEGNALQQKIQYFESKHKARISSHVTRTALMGGMGVENALAVLENKTNSLSQLIESNEAKDRRIAMVDMVNTYAQSAAKGDNPFKNDFEGRGEVPKGISLENGKLGCAWVASTFLQKFGYINERETAVDNLMPKLIRNGFIELAPGEKPFPGCVVKWDPIERTQTDPKGKKEWIKAKHPHVGIVIGPGRVVDNHGSDGPLEGPLERYNNDGPPPTLRKTTILKPPTTVTATTAALNIPAEKVLKIPVSLPLAQKNPPKLNKSEIQINTNPQQTIDTPKSKTTEIIANRAISDIKEINADHASNLPKIKINAEKAIELKKLAEKFRENRQRYEKVAAATNVPAELIFFLHQRESSGNFNTYLHNGDPLGKPTTHHPKDKFFNDWESAATDALKMHSSIQQKLGINRATNDVAQLATYAEFYNGTGYRKKGHISPYVYSWTNAYEKGKYVADRKFDLNAIDQQPGAVAVLKTLFEQK